MRNPPPEVIKTWPKPNYVNPEYAGPELAIIGVTFTTLSIIVMSLRMYVRLHLRKAASWDDWLMVAAIVRSSSFSPCPIAGHLANISTIAVFDGHLSISNCQHQIWMG